MTVNSELYLNLMRHKPAMNAHPDPVYIFIAERGHSMPFHVDIADDFERNEAESLIIENGGRVEEVLDCWTTILVSDDANPESYGRVVFNVSYVLDCIIRRTLLPLGPYAVGRQINASFYDVIYYRTNAYKDLRIYDAVESDGVARYEVAIEDDPPRRSRTKKTISCDSPIKPMVMVKPMKMKRKKTSGHDQDSSKMRSKLSVEDSSSKDDSRVSSASSSKWHLAEGSGTCSSAERHKKRKADEVSAAAPPCSKALTQDSSAPRSAEHKKRVDSSSEDSSSKGHMAGAIPRAAHKRPEAHSSSKDSAFGAPKSAEPIKKRKDSSSENISSASSAMHSKKRLAEESKNHKAEDLLSSYKQSTRDQDSSSEDSSRVKHTKRHKDHKAKSSKIPIKARYKESPESSKAGIEDSDSCSTVDLEAEMVKSSSQRRIRKTTNGSSSSEDSDQEISNKQPVKLPSKKFTKSAEIKGSSPVKLQKSNMANSKAPAKTKTISHNRVPMNDRPQKRLVLFKESKADSESSEFESCISDAEKQPKVIETITLNESEIQSDIVVSDSDSDVIMMAKKQKITSKKAKNHDIVVLDSDSDVEHQVIVIQDSGDETSKSKKPKDSTKNIQKDGKSEKFETPNVSTIQADKSAETEKTKRYAEDKSNQKASTSKDGPEEKSKDGLCSKCNESQSEKCTADRIDENKQKTAENELSQKASTSKDGSKYNEKLKSAEKENDPKLPSKFIQDLQRGKDKETEDTLRKGPEQRYAEKETRIQLLDGIVKSRAIASIEHCVSDPDFPSSPVTRTGPLRRPYTRRDQEAILMYIVRKKSHHSSLRSNPIWRRMEKANICSGRTWQSLKNHFLKTLVHELDRFPFLSPDEKVWMRGNKE